MKIKLFLSLSLWFQTLLTSLLCCSSTYTKNLNKTWLILITYEIFIISPSLHTALYRINYITVEIRAENLTVTSRRPSSEKKLLKADFDEKLDLMNLVDATQKSVVDNRSTLRNFTVFRPLVSHLSRSRLPGGSTY